MRVRGVVKDASTEKPLAGAKVGLYVGEKEIVEVRSDDKGLIEHAEANQYIGKDLLCKVEKKGYKSREETYRIEGEEVQLDLSLTPDVEVKVVLTLKLRDEMNHPVKGANVTLERDGKREGADISDKDGFVEFSFSSDFENKAIKYKAEQEGYESATGEINLKKETSHQTTMKRLSKPPSIDWKKIAVAVAVVILAVGIWYFMTGREKKEPPPEAKRRLSQGITFASLQDWKNALVEFNAAIEAYPQYGTAYANRGIVYMRLGKFNFSEDDLKKAVELSPSDPFAHYNLAVLYSTTGKLDRGIFELDKALEYGFDNYDALKSSGPGSDPDLYNLRGHPDYKTTLEKHKVFVD